MEDGMLLILTGPPGAGKTTVGAIIASESPLSACIHSDWFWTTIVNGHIPPWERAADTQTRAVIRAAAASGVRMARLRKNVYMSGPLCIRRASVLGFYDPQQASITLAEREMSDRATVRAVLMHEFVHRDLTGLPQMMGTRHP